MIAVDAGILAFAINRGAPEHLRAAPALETLVGGERPWALPLSAVHEFLRLVTHRHAVVHALGALEAWGFVERLLESPAVDLLAPTPHHARVAAEVLALADRSAGVPAGFETAVLLREHGVRELLSADPSMRRYPFLTVVDPVHGPPWSPEVGPARRYRVLGPRRTRL